MRLRIVDQLRRGVKAHRLAVDERRREFGWVMAFEPGGDIREQGEAGGVRFGEAVLAEALDLLVDLIGELRRKASFEQAVAKLVAELFDDAAAPPGAHGAAQLIRL